jgi:hypothetical protein
MNLPPQTVEAMLDDLWLDWKTSVAKDRGIRPEDIQQLADEKAILTEFIVDMGVALGALAARGTHVELTILDRAGGGVYVALASPATRVAVVFGADVQVLPGPALASILGESREAIADIAEYRSAGVADVELRLGILP